MSKNSRIQILFRFTRQCLSKIINLPQDFIMEKYGNYWRLKYAPMLRTIGLRSDSLGPMS